jgi:hypothetical protein
MVQIVSILGIGFMAYSLGSVTQTVAGSATSSGFIDGPFTSARFGNPIGVVLSTAGDLFVSDQLNNAVRLLSSSGPSCCIAITPASWSPNVYYFAGTVTTIAGQASAGVTNGFGTSAQLSIYVAQLCLTTGGKLYLADGASGRIRLIDTTGTTLSVYVTIAFN